MLRKARKTERKYVAETPDSSTSVSNSEKSTLVSAADADASQNAQPENMTASVSLQEKVALLAYSYWEERGRQEGSPEEDWFRAENEILSQISSRDEA
jgi:hypothetical protein